MGLPVKKLIKAGAGLTPVGGLLSLALGPDGRPMRKRRRRKHLTGSQKNDILWIAAHVSKKAAGNYLAGRGF